MEKAEKTVGEMLILFQQELVSRYSVNEIKAILYRLFDASLGWTRATVQINKGRSLSKQSDTYFKDALRRLIAGEPVQYIIGYTEFCGLTLKVQPGVFIPRPETEELAVLIARENQHVKDHPISILDVCAGSGCLALALKRAFPLSRVTGIERSSDALCIARENAADNRLDVTFKKGDALDPAIFTTPIFFDLMVSNPPYIPESERPGLGSHVVDHEPESALFVPDDHPLMFYEAIGRLAHQHLAQNGILYVEIHEAYGAQTAGLFRAQGFQSVTLHRDFLGKDRFVKALAPL